jgi:anti-anti-sigma factor
MEARLSYQGDITVVTLKGKLDIEKSGIFRRSCLEKLKAKKVVFNLNELSFVGSSGITPFINTIVELSKEHDVRLCGVAYEFKKLIQLTHDPKFPFFENENLALQSFSHPLSYFIEKTIVEPVSFGENN